MVQCLCQPPVRPSVPGARLQPRHGARSVCQLRARAGAFAQRAPFARTRRWQTCDPRGLVCVRAEDEDAADPEALARVEQELRGTCAFVVDKFISDGMVVAFGDGMLSAFAMEYLAGKIEAKELKDVQAVPATASAAAEAALHGLRLAMPGDFEKYDLFIQEVDEVDRHNLAVIVGRSSQPRQPELMKHRLAALKADKMIALVQGNYNVSDRLGFALPVLADAEDWEEIGEEIDDIFVGDAEVWRRGSSDDGAAMDARGGAVPYVSEDGKTIFDVVFEKEGLVLFSKKEPYQKIVTEIMAVPGVATVGLIMHPHPVAVVSTEDGPQVLEVERLTAE